MGRTGTHHAFADRRALAAFAGAYHLGGGLEIDAIDAGNPGVLMLVDVHHIIHQRLRCLGFLGTEVGQAGANLRLLFFIQLLQPGRQGRRSIGKITATQPKLKPHQISTPRSCAYSFRRSAFMGTPRFQKMMRFCFHSLAWSM